MELVADRDPEAALRSRRPAAIISGDDEPLDFWPPRSTSRRMAPLPGSRRTVMSAKKAPPPEGCP
jgi:hypothetical protein